MIGIFGIAEGVLSIGVPVALAGWLIQRHRLHWKLFWIGAAICTASEILGALILWGLSSVVSLDKLVYSPEVIWLLAAIIIGIVNGIVMVSLLRLGFLWAGAKGASHQAALTIGAGAGLIAPIEAILFLSIVLGMIALSCVRPSGFAINLPIVNYTLTLNSCNTNLARQTLLSDVMTNLNSLLQIFVPLSTFLPLSAIVWISIRLKRFRLLIMAMLWQMLIFSAHLFLTNDGYVPWVLPALNRASYNQIAIGAILNALNLGLLIWCLHRATSIHQQEEIKVVEGS